MVPTDPSPELSPTNILLNAPVLLPVFLKFDYGYNSYSYATAEPIRHLWGLLFYTNLIYAYVNSITTLNQFHNPFSPMLGNDIFMV